MEAIPGERVDTREPVSVERFGADKPTALRVAWRFRWHNRAQTKLLPFPFKVSTLSFWSLMVGCDCATRGEGQNYFPNVVPQLLMR